MKKVLSWVLTLALVLSSFAMAFAADTANSSEMNDSASINNVEAVDVMVATGIISGFPDGNFYPEKTVTRAEMAKMISIAANGGEDVGDYYKSACTFADSVNHWAAGYIGYCANQGIIDGRSASVFDPDATVTGVEAAKMMLIALGYDSKIEGYTGEQWAAKVLKAAKENDLFDGCDNFKSDAALTRDNAAQIIFNGLQANTVEYDFDAEITVGDTVVSVNTTVHDSNEPLYDSAFEGDLVKKDLSGDEFGRPAHSWSYDKDKIGDYSDEADFSFVVEDADSLEAALDEYDEGFCEDYGTEWCVENDAVILNGIKQATFTNDLLENCTDVALGDVVEFFDVTEKTDDMDVYKVVVSHYVMARISSVDTDVTSKDERNGISAYLEIEAKEWSNKDHDYDSYSFEEDSDMAGYNAKDYVEEAIIAVAICDDSIIDSFVPEMKSGEVTKKFSGGKAYTVDGQKYETIGNDFYAIADYDDDTVKDVATDNSYDFYMANGYLLGAVLLEEESDDVYGLLLGTKKDRDADEDPYEYQLKILTADGDTVWYEVEEEDLVDNCTAISRDNISTSASYGALYNLPGKETLVKFELNSDDEIDVIAAATESGTKLDTKEKSGVYKYNGKKISDDIVIFSDANDDADDRDWTVSGKDELIDAKGVSATYFLDDGYIVAMYAKEGLGATTDVFGFFDEESDSWTSDGDTYYTLAFLADGKTVSYDTTKKFAGAIPGTSAAFDKLYKVTLNADNEIKAVTEADLTQITTDYDAVDDFDGADGVYCSVSTTVKKVDGSKLVLNDGDETEIDVSDAIVYKYNTDGELEKTSLSKAKGYTVTLYQYVEDDEAWNLVVIDKK